MCSSVLCGFPWVPLGSLGFPWVPLGPLGSPRVPQGSPWVPLGSPGLPGAPLGSLGLPWVPLGSPGFPLGSPLGFPWVPLGCPGCPRVPLGPLGFPGVPLGPLGFPGPDPSQTRWKHGNGGIGISRSRLPVKLGVAMCFRSNSLQATPCRCYFSSNPWEAPARAVGFSSIPRESWVPLGSLVVPVPCGSAAGKSPKTPYRGRS